MIFKLQRPVVGKGGVLVYNQSRSHQGQVPMTPQLRQLFTKGRLKIFVEGSYDLETGLISIDHTVPDQGW